MKDQLDYCNLQKFLQTLLCDVYITKCPTAALKTMRFTVKLLQSFTRKSVGIGHANWRKEFCDDFFSWKRGENEGNNKAIEIWVFLYLFGTVLILNIPEPNVYFSLTWSIIWAIKMNMKKIGCTSSMRWEMRKIF
jgi:hypothetical protein